MGTWVQSTTPITPGHLRQAVVTGFGRLAYSHVILPLFRQLDIFAVDTGSGLHHTLQSAADSGVVHSKCVANDELKAASGIESYSNQQLVHWCQAVTSLCRMHQFVLSAFYLTQTHLQL